MRQDVRLADPGEKPVRQPVGIRLRFGVLVLALMLAICAPLFIDSTAQDAPCPSAGAVSYRGFDFARPVALSGGWRLAWMGGAPPGSPVPRGAAATIPIPGGWGGARTESGATLPGSGVARLRLTLRDLPPGRYTLYVPIIFGAYRVLIDGRPVASAGRIGMDAASTRYALRAQDVALESDGRPVVLDIEVASFLHRESGIGDPLVLGTAAAMGRWTALQWGRGFLFLASLLLLACNALATFLFRREDRISLLLALSALATVPGAAILGHDNLLLILMPGMPFAVMLAIQYASSDFAVLAFLAYARSLYPEESPRRLVLAVEGTLGALVVSQMLACAAGETLFASRIAMAWPLVSALAFATIIAIVLRAARRRRAGAAIFLLGMSVFAVLFLSVALYWSGLVPPRLLWGPGALPLGMLMLLFSHIVVAAERWSLTLVSTERTNAELRELIEVNAAITSEVHVEALLARIVEATSRILNAERSTLFLHDPKADQLWSLIAEGLKTREIRMSAEEGLAGHAFQHGVTVNVPDAYADPRFNRGLDEHTGYRTTSILTMAITARDGRRLGVMQALNRRDAGAFSRADEQRMAAFAAQAAIAIDNANLFTEIEASRAYSESILRSMSSGVVTLDADAGIAKLNAAACRILGVDAGAIEGRDARELLAVSNPWLIDQIGAVRATGEPVALLDVDMLTGKGETISANLSIVPLVGEGGPAGLLLLIEDISEGKRLQGAMRRFMTAEVVDQVLERRDELLFGTQCDASVLFADIRNFTTMAEALTPRETVDMLNEAFTEFFEAVAASGGVLDKFIGDAIMAVYGAPISSGRDPDNAVESGTMMLRTLGDLNLRRAERGLPPLRLGIGVASGAVIAGTIGSPKRMDYTVIGDSVNLASRLQDLTKLYGVEMLVCERTANAVGPRARLREVDLILVRGRTRPAKIFQVIPPGSGVSPTLLDAYREGREAMARRDWRGAGRAFTDALRQSPDDTPSRIMLERARALAADPPGADWNGVWSAGGPK